MATQTQTGASNIEFDLVAEMHELLDGNAALERYMEDARQAGDREAESCFKKIRDQNRESVGTLRSLLAKYLTAPQRAAS
jgi:hypothetical protein